MASNGKTESVFVDTNVYVALNDKIDSTHGNAFALLKRLEEKQLKSVTSSGIISEALTIISQKVSKEKALDFWRSLQKTNTQIVFVDENVYHEALNLFPKIKSKNVSFVDCTSFIIMKSRGIKIVFTFDQHFKSQGFKLLSDVV